MVEKKAKIIDRAHEDNASDRDVRFFLERRKEGAAKGRDDKTPASASVSVKRFVKQLSQCQKSFVNSGKDFALIALTILESSKLEKDHGKQSARMLDRLTTNILLANLRGKDRLFSPSPATYLILMPGIKESEIAKVADRLVGLLSETVFDLGDRSIRPSPQVNSICASTSQAKDLASMLAQAGFVLQSGGLIVSSGNRLKSKSDSPLAFRGSLDQWLSRYRLYEEEEAQIGAETGTYRLGFKRGQDLWNNENQILIRFLKFEQFEQYVPIAERVLLIKRLRHLEAITNPGLSRLVDFHLDGNCLYLVNSIGACQSCLIELDSEDERLSEKIGARKDILLESLLKLYSELFWLWSLVPPVVPCMQSDDFSKLKIFLISSNAGRAVLFNFDIDFLLSRSPDSLCQVRIIKGLAGFIEKLDFKLGFLVSSPYSCLLTDLGGDELPFELESLSRLKARLKELNT